MPPHWDTVAILGVGLIGGSVGLALRERGLARRVIGTARSAGTLRAAVQAGAVTEATASLQQAVAEAEVVVVCTPVAATAKAILEAAASSPPTALITDAASTKSTIVNFVEAALALHRRHIEKALDAAARERRRKTRKPGPPDPPATFRVPAFVGAHPLAGSEKAGPLYARADLFVGRTVIVTPTPRTPPDDLARARGFWESLGADVVEMSARRHDAAVAAVSHLPHLAASAVAAATPEKLLPLAAGGWLDTTRVAAGDAELWTQILQDNRDHVLKALGEFEKVLAAFREALEQDDPRRLARLLAAGKARRDAVAS